jgi:hypothetical protein
MPILSWASWLWCHNVFSIQGRIANSNRTYVLTWDAGNLDGDMIPVRAVQALAQGAEGSPVGPVEGPYTRRNHLSSPLSTLILCARVFDPGFRTGGDVPIRPPIPEGATG